MQFVRVYVVFGKIIYLVNFLCYWGNFHCRKCPNIDDKIAIWSHLESVLNKLQLVVLLSSIELTYSNLEEYRPYFTESGHFLKENYDDIGILTVH